MDELNRALHGSQSAGIQVVSSLPEWVELRVPCSFEAISPLHELVKQLNIDLPNEIRDDVSYAFTEMLSNAVEHGGKGDPTGRIEVRFVRLKRAVLCRIKDPGDGFNPALLDHSAIKNPNHDPLRHLFVREAKGLRAGGYGILLTRQLVDELVYNERHNEVLFLKYLP